LAHFWASVALNEHASIPAFQQLVLELLAFGAPAALVRDAQRAGLDETRHAAEAFALASAFWGAPLGPAPRRWPFEVPSERSLAEWASKVASEGCVDEAASLGAAMAMRDAATDVAVRRMLDRLVRDEERHVALSWRIVRWAVEVGGPDVAGAVRGALARPPSDTATSGPYPARWAAFGALSDAALVSAGRRVYDDVVRPIARVWPLAA
jgi:hypothetical protein